MLNFINLFIIKSCIKKKYGKSKYFIILFGFFLFLNIILVFEALIGFIYGKVHSKGKGIALIVIIILEVSLFFKKKKKYKKYKHCIVNQINFYIFIN